MSETQPGLGSGRSQDDQYQRAVVDFGPALERLARAYEADLEKRRDLLQEIHFGLWRSFAGYDARCSLRTWVYRVAHNTASSHILRQHRTNSRMVSLENVENTPDGKNLELATDQHKALDRLLVLIQSLNPLDRQVILSYLEGMEAASIAEITGLSSPAIATKIHRIKNILTRRFHERGCHGG
jgi:RNA polymerase sigma-70 factor (ECF subfamily)